MPMVTKFLVRQDNINETKFAKSEMPTPAEGQVLLKVDFFSFTANNITYAVIGKQFGYWQFFPEKESGWGVVPVWGFADVVSSNNPDIAEGERIYGYWPMASHVLLEPGNVQEARFTDKAAHRQELPKIYNEYVRLKADPYYDPNLEEMRALWFPLAGTAFGLYDWLRETSFQEAETVLLVSASSKTALGLARLLKKHADKDTVRNIVALTATRNQKSVEKMGYYNQIITYDDITALDSTRPTVIVDFSGNGEVLSKLHRRLGQNMRHTAIVGASHWDEARKGDGYIEARSRLFFMPAYAAQRLTETKGAFGHELYAASKEMAEEASAWMKPLRASTMAEIDILYQKVRSGRIAPDVGGIISLGQA